MDPLKHLRRTLQDFNELATTIPPKHIDACVALVTGVHDITAALIESAAASAAASVQGAARQSTEDILTMWANELEFANRNALITRTPQGYKALAKALATLLEGHAKTLRWNIEHLPHKLNQGALISYGKHHLPMWDKALSSVCELAGVSRKTSDNDMYFVFRCAAGMETNQACPDDGFDSDTVDLNDSDEDW